MKRVHVLQIIMNVILLAVFNAIFFIAGEPPHRASVWISYLFVHIAFVLLLLTPMLIRKGTSSAVFGISIYSLASYYFLAELAVGVVFILFSPEGFRAALLIQLSMAGLYGIILISRMIVSERKAEAEVERQHQIAYAKEATEKIQRLLDNVRDKEAKKRVERIYDTLQTSPVKSHPDLEDMEKRILRAIDELSGAVSDGKNKDTVILLSDSLLNLLNERNLQLKALKIK
jgi:signal transduction histidine kinase